MGWWLSSEEEGEEALQRPPPHPGLTHVLHPHLTPGELPMWSLLGEAS